MNARTFRAQRCASYQAAAIPFDCERISQWAGPHACDPNYAGSLYFQAIILVFERDVIFSHAYDPSFGVHFNAFVLQGVFDELPNLFSHSRHESIRHLDNHDTRLTAQSPSLHCVAQQCGHLCR